MGMNLRASARPGAHSREDANAAGSVRREKAWLGAYGMGTRSKQEMIGKLG